MKLQIVHSTRYRYTGPIAESVMEVRLRPMDGGGQRCTEFSLELSSGLKPRGYMDGYGNHVHYFNLSRPHTGLSIVSRSVVETGLGDEPEPGEELVQDFLRFRSPVKDVEGVREITMGVPARYVSGYIHLPGDRGPTTASHAWAEAWVPGRGWIGYDATRPVRTTDHHVRLAVGRDYTDAAPTRGVYVGSATGAMQVRVRTRELK